jgi:hypothetical protein
MEEDTYKILADNAQEYLSESEIASAIAKGRAKRAPK